MQFRKAHGTGNDFVVLPDRDGRILMTQHLVRHLCDRRFGIGADGVLRVVRTAAAGERVADSEGCEFFMDYRNADGSHASMCGNGARVFAQYLWDSGWAPPDAGVRFATRGGARYAKRTQDGQIRVDMGPAVIGAPGAVRVSVDGRTWPATAVHVPNPHAVAFVADLADAGPLLAVPRLQPENAYPDGANVEFVVVRGPGRIAMRVHERGVGETLSCGTGACAAAVAYAADHRRSAEPFPLVQVDVPGGTLRVSINDDGTVALTGPAVTVAEGTVADQWLDLAQ